MTPADIPREAVSVFNDVNANKLGKYTIDHQYKLIALYLFTMEEQIQ